jgi:hypothetical protein
MTALWNASDRVCGKRLVAMVPTLMPAPAQHGRLQLGEGEPAQLALAVRSYSTFITSLSEKARKLAAKRIPAMAMSPVSNEPVKSRSHPIR